MRTSLLAFHRVPTVVTALAFTIVSCAESGDASVADTQVLQDSGDGSSDGSSDVAPGTDALPIGGEDAAQDALGADGDSDTIAAVDTATGDVCAGKPDGANCDLDGDPCTIDVCASESCIATNGVESCAAEAALEPCWTFKCESGTGCEKSVFASDIACDDANACTVGDRCQSSVKACLGSGIPVDDQNPCTADTCKDGVIAHEPTSGAACVASGQSGTCDGSVCKPAGCTPVDGGWSEWTWSACSEPCGDGTRTGTRTCDAPTPYCGGASCDGESETTGPCNVKPCTPLGDVTACPADLPFAPGSACLSLPAAKPFTQLVTSTIPASDTDNYGVKLVAGPGGTVAALYSEDEWFERYAANGTPLLAPVSLPAKNPDIAPSAFGDSGFPAFYGAALGFDGEQFVVARPSNMAPDLHVYAVDPSGTLALGPVTIAGPDGAINGDQGPAIEWTGDGWLVAWRVYLGGNDPAVLVARLDPDLDQDVGFGDGGFLVLEGFSRHPELAVSSDGQTAALVSGEISFELAVFSATDGALVAKTPVGCAGGSQGTNGDGNDVVWNDTLGEFGVLHSSQGAGLCDTTVTSVNATLLRVSAGGEWLGPPLPILCGFPIGAGFRGAIAAWPDGRYGIAMQRYHGKPYCQEPFLNGTQGTDSFDLVTVEPTSQTISTWHTHVGVTTTYSQTDLVWTGSVMVALSGKGIGGASAGYAFEP